MLELHALGGHGQCASQKARIVGVILPVQLVLPVNRYPNHVPGASKGWRRYGTGGTSRDTIGESRDQQECDASQRLTKSANGDRCDPRTEENALEALGDFSNLHLVCMFRAGVDHVPSPDIVGVGAMEILRQPPPVREDFPSEEASCHDGIRDVSIVHEIGLK
jgi:hypothetical protein